MSENATYSVVLSGNLKSGFEPEAVIDAFARLFKLPPEKAGKILAGEFVIKREVELKIAKTYKDKLADIGVEVLLKRHGGIGEMSLEAMQLPNPKVTGDATAVAAAVALAAGEMLCPKCELKQSKAEECSGCGVIIAKVMKIAAQSGGAQIVSQQTEGEPVQDDSLSQDVHSDEAVGLKALIAPIAVAVLGAILWYLIAIKLEYEYGAVAWLIGGAVGYAAVTSGARGNATAVICGLLVLVSICGGKYMTVSSQQTELAAVLSGATEYEGIDLKEFYQVELIDAREFMKLPGDDTSLRHFMAEREFSEFTVASKVTDDELEFFREFTAPRLEDVYSSEPSFEEWRQDNLSNSIEDLSTFDLMTGSFGLIDFVFLFLGIGSAFQLVIRNS